MSNVVAPVRVGVPSPRAMARWIGVLTLLTLLGAAFAQGYVSDRFIVWTDAKATADNLIAHRDVFLWGLAIYLIEMACSVAVTALQYHLLEPVNRSLSLVAAFLGLAGCMIKTTARVFFAAPLFMVGNAHGFHGLDGETVDALAMVLLTVNDHGAGVAMAFFGFSSVLSGVLVLRSTFLPRVLGALMIVGGLGWLTHLWPPLGYRLFPVLVLLAFPAVILKIFWMLVFGVNEKRWHEQAEAGRRPVHAV